MVQYDKIDYGGYNMVTTDYSKKEVWRQILSTTLGNYIFMEKRLNNKITKKRLSDFFSYEWIVMTVVIVVAIFLWEMLFSAIAVKPTTGQNFKYYIDKNIVCPRNDTFKSGLINKNTACTFIID